MDEHITDQQIKEKQSQSQHSKSHSPSDPLKDSEDHSADQNIENKQVSENNEQSDINSKSHKELSRDNSRNIDTREGGKSKDSSLDWGQNASGNDLKQQANPKETESQGRYDLDETPYKAEYVQKLPKAFEEYYQQPHSEYTQNFDTRNINCLIRDSNEYKARNSERSDRVKFPQEFVRSVDTIREKQAYNDAEALKERILVDRPQTRTKDDDRIRLRKRFIIKRKRSKSKTKNILKAKVNQKKWDDRFFVQTKESKLKDPVSILFRKFHGPKASVGKISSAQVAKQASNQMKETREVKMRTLRNQKFEKMWNNRFAVDEKYISNSETRKFSKTMRPKSMMNIKRQQEDPRTTSEIANKQQISPENEYNNRINIRTSRGSRPKTGEKKYWKVNSINDYGWSNNNMFANILRSNSNKKIDKYNQMKEKNWNQRFAIPISTYNESVFMRYRLSFDKI